MKLLKTVLLIIIFSSVVYPCDEADTFLFNESAPAVSDDEPGNAENCCDSFCFCLCCSVLGAAENIQTLNNLLISLPIVCSYQNNYPFTLSIPVFQPPKLQPFFRKIF
jgi:hypothetical protein